MVEMGEDILNKAIEDPTLDKYLDRAAKLNTKKDYQELVGLLQKKRAMFITAEQNKRAGLKPEGETETEEQEG
jgi:hypothetical protein